ncbi:MAG TPA: response regulator [Anaerolineae bacterium]|nr:response regulator [Anaerolineae bacterium]
MTSKNKPSADTMQASRPTIGLLCNEANNVYAESIWGGVHEAMQAHGANLLFLPGGMLPAENGPRLPSNILYDLIDPEWIDGLIIWGAQLSHIGGPEAVIALCQRYAPLPIVNIGLTLPGVASILVDNYQGMHDVVVHLIEVHHLRRIAYEHGPDANPESQARYRGYLDALNEHGISPDPHLVATGDEILTWRNNVQIYRENTYRIAGIRVLLDNHQLRPQIDFDAVVCNDDNLAVGTLEELQACGVQVPRDIAVVGFDDIVEARYAMPPMTTVRQSFNALGYQSGEMLLAHLRGQTLPEQTMFPMQVIVRRSCGCLDPAIEQAARPPLNAPLSCPPDAIPNELRQALSLTESDPLYPWIPHLLEALFTELRGTTPRIFLTTLEETLRHIPLEEDPIQTLQIAISTMRRYLWPTFDAETAARVETLWRQAYITIGAAAQRKPIHQLTLGQQREQNLRNVGHVLLSTFDIASLTHRLSWGLTQLNVPHAYLALYEDPAHPTTWARLIMTHVGDTLTIPPPEAQRFPARQLLPADAWPQDAPYSMVVEPFYFQDEALGFGVFATGKNSLRVYGILRNEISIALKGALLLQERERAEAALEQRAAELAQAKEKIEQAFQQAEMEKERAEIARRAAEEAHLASERARETAEVARRTAERAQREVEAVNKALEAQIWHTNGHAQLNNRMRGEQAVGTLAANVVEQLCEYLQLQTGVLYVRENDVLLPAGGYALPRRDGPPPCFNVGEGLVGQAVQSCKALVLTRVPPDYAAIASGLGSAPPQTIVIMPFLYEGQAVGVVELGSFTEFDPEQVKFLQTAMENIAIAFNTAQARDRINELLSQTQQQAEELQAQGEALRVANEELEAQTESLRLSETRLREQQGELEIANQELKQRQAQLDRQNRSLKEAQNDLEHKAEELARASKYKSEFLANMSHELRTPLNSLLILAQMLANNEERNLTAEQVESARVIYNSGADLLNLINEILDLSKVEAGRMTFHFESVPLRALLDAMRAQFAHVAETKELAFHLLLDDDLPAHIETDQQRVEQILKNLLANAFKFTEKGSVSFRIARPAPDVKFAHSLLTPESTIAFHVMDTGIGMTPAQQKIVFEAFQQADGSTSRKYGGTGLGLTISRELVAHLGGEIALTSEYGRGSTFTLYLPLKPPEELPEGAEANHRRGSAAPGSRETGEAPRTGAVRRGRKHAKKPSSTSIATSPAPSPPASSASQRDVPDDRDILQPGDRTLLIIEDDANFAKIVRDYAHKKGFKCLLAGDGQMGLHLAQTHIPHAIILDLNLPLLNGEDVLLAIKDNPATRHIPVHIMSVADEDMSLYKNGAIGFLTKPVGAADLEASFQRIEQVIAREIKALLLVEDDENLRHSVTTLLGGADVQIVEAGTGQAALEWLQKQPFDCMILDLTLPDMSGFELLDRLNAAKVALHCPVIVYTGQELTAEENHRLLQYAENETQPLRIIIKGVKSPERLLDETALFLHRVVANMPEETQRTIKRLHDPEAVFTGKRILVVDDDARSAYALSKLLADKGLKPTIAGAGEKALALLQQSDYDLVLMDIMMPEMDGYETIQRIREQPHRHDLPILALTAKAMKGDREKCLEAGANDYLPKPVDAERLFSMLRVWLYH